MTSSLRAVSFILIGIACLGSARADDTQSEKETRLRDALKAAYAQLQTVQEQNATLQVAQAESDKERDALKTQVQTLSDQLKAESTKNTLAAQTATGQINQLKIQSALLQRKMDEDETRNVELYRLANEILTRYEKFSLGDALAAKEPFTQLTRVKLENLVQGYQDKLLAQRVGSGASAARTSTTDTALPK